MLHPYNTNKHHQTKMHPHYIIIWLCLSFLNQSWWVRITGTKLESSVEFSPDTNPLDTPPFRSNGRGLCNIPLMAEADSPPFRPSGWGLLGILPLGRGCLNNPPLPDPQYGGPQPPPSLGRKTSCPPPRPIGRWSLLSNHFPGPPLWDAMFLGSPNSSFPPLYSLLFPILTRGSPILGSPPPPYKLSSYPPPPDMPHPPPLWLTISLPLGISNWFPIWQPGAIRVKYHLCGFPIPLFELAYDALPRVRFPVWLLSHPILAGDHATLTDKDRQFSALTKEAKEFCWQSATKVSYT